MSDETKPTPGYRTLAFWITTAIAAAGAFAGTGMADAGIGAQVLGYVVAIGAIGGYTVHRGFVKADGTVSKPGWKKSEFWLSLAAMVVTALTASGAWQDSNTFMLVMSAAGTVLTALGYQVGKGAEASKPGGAA